MTHRTYPSDVNGGSITARRLAIELKDAKTRPRAIDEIAEAFEKTEGNAVHAAQKLGVSHRGLMRWIKETPALEKRVRTIRKRFDHPHEVGEPGRRKA